MGLQSTARGLHTFCEKCEGKAAFVVLKVFKSIKITSLKISLNLA